MLGKIKTNNTQKNKPNRPTNNSNTFFRKKIKQNERSKKKFERQDKTAWWLNLLANTTPGLTLTLYL